MKNRNIANHSPIALSVRVNRPLRPRIAASGDARGPSFPLDLALPLLCTGYPNTKRRFLRARSHAVQGLPFVSLPLNLPSPSSSFLVLFPQASFHPRRVHGSFSGALVVPSRFLTLLGRVFFSPMRPCARAYTGCPRIQRDSSRIARLP